MNKIVSCLLAFLVFTLVVTSNALAVPAEVKLLPSDGTAGSLFGGGQNDGNSAVSISGNYAIVGAQGIDPVLYPDDPEPYPDGDKFGAAYIYHFDGSNWVEQQKLTASDGAEYDNFGISVSISGNDAIVGANLGDGNITDSGAVYIYHYDGANWVEQQKLTASDASNTSYFGENVSISGNFAIVGATRTHGNNYFTGSAYIYYFDGNNWIEQQKLTASDGDTSDLFGCSVSISGDYAIVGAWHDDDLVTDAGSAYIFHYNGSSWIEQQKIYASNATNGNRFGIAVSISDENAIVGAMLGDGLVAKSGSAYIFHYDGFSWVEQQKLIANDGEYLDWYGYTVSISTDNAIVGSSFHGVDGAAYLYHLDETEWIGSIKLVPGDANGTVGFGYSVSVSSDKAIVGNPFKSDNGHRSGSAYIYSDLIPDSSIDADGDGYDVTLDCNDNDASINPGAVDTLCDGIDQDCSGSDAVDATCTDADADGYTADVDCNDNDSAINPGATDTPPSDGIDQDCSGNDAACSDYGDNTSCNTDLSCEWSGSPKKGSCQDYVPSAPEICDDGIDNDGDDLSDCDDPDCYGVSTCQVSVVCSDFDGDESSCLANDCRWNKKKLTCS